MSRNAKHHKVTARPRHRGRACRGQSGDSAPSWGEFSPPHNRRTVRNGSTPSRRPRSTIPASAATCRRSTQPLVCGRPDRTWVVRDAVAWAALPRPGGRTRRRCLRARVTDASRLAGVLRRAAQPGRRSARRSARPVERRRDRHTRMTTTKAAVRGAHQTRTLLSPGCNRPRVRWRADHHSHQRR
jgi:hypothetical protein